MMEMGTAALERRSCECYVEPQRDEVQMPCPFSPQRGWLFRPGCSVISTQSELAVSIKTRVEA